MSRYFVRLFFIILSGVYVSTSVLAATFTVTSLADSTATGTLRWAINSANSSSPPHTINFNIPSPFRIAPGIQLPTITNRNILITGTNQPGYAGTPIVTLSGTGITDNATYGLVLAGNGITVQGIAVERFATFASEGIFITGSTNRIESCLIRSNYIGISMWSPARQTLISRNTISHNPNAGIRAVSSAGGQTVSMNTITFNGYGLDWNSPNSVIGGGFLLGNVIGANTNHGLFINQASATNIQVSGNFIGVDATGTNALGNGQSGVRISGADGIFIGGNDATFRNIISANGRHGVQMDGSANRNNWVWNNYIGVNSSLLPLGNGTTTGSGSGIHMENAIGASIYFNVIGGNRGHGIGIYGATSYSNRIDRNFIGVNFSGNPVSNRLSGVYIGGGSNTIIGIAGSIFRNIISANGDYGIEISGATNHSHVIANNYIGTDTAGTIMRSNGRGGIRIHNGQDIQVGDPVLGFGFTAGNIISGNALNGILVEGTNARAISIQNNLIGVDATGTNMLNNTANGIFIAGGSNITIGVSGRNVISGNQQHGIAVTNARNVQVVNNLIGVGTNTSVAVRNFFSGIHLTNRVGAVTMTSNVISGNLRNGIEVFGAGVSNVFTFGNRIGVNQSGTQVVPNGENGIRLINPHGGSIGSVVESDRNIIGGNEMHGIFISGATNQNIFILANSIGVDASGTQVLSNRMAGLRIEFSTATIVIGGAFTNWGNFISGNMSNGIHVTSSHNLQIFNNMIGINNAGNAGMGNRGAGILLENSCSTNFIMYNVIANNVGPGIHLNSLIENAFIEANFIGRPRGSAFTDRGNQGPGILVSGSENIRYGNPDNPNGGRNAIAFNQGPGIAITSVYFSVRLRHEIYGNLIYNNTGIPVDLNFNGVTPNDSAPDADSGFANNYQNYPVLTTARRGPQFFAYGTLISAPNSDYRIEYFASDPVFGQRYLGFTNIFLPASGTGSFVHTFSNFGIATNATIFATATTTNEGTSEYSAGILFRENLTDTDNDGMPDWWELVHGFNHSVSNAPGTDTDADGFTDLEEWLAFTEPRDPNSYPVITAIVGEPNRVVTFPSVDERVYRLDRNSAIDTNPVWTMAVGPVTGQIGFTSMTNTAMPSDHDTYRIRIGLP